MTTRLPLLDDLRAFIALLESAGDLTRVRIEVDPVHEVTAVTDRVSKAPGGGKALLFERVRGHESAVATNLFGSERRADWALGVSSGEQAGRRLEQALAALPGSAAERLLRLTAGKEERHVRLVDGAPCREVAEAADLTLLPALKAWPGDGGRFLTLPLVFTSHPETGERNCGIYRMQLFDAGSAGLNLRPGADAGRHLSAWHARGQPMPVAIALGGPPALFHAAAAPLPAGVDEVAFAAWLRSFPLAMAPCRHSNLCVPAGAEFVLEGYIAPGDARLEGPFGNHTGSYAPASPAPVFRLVSMTHRRNALLPATVAGPPPTENCRRAKSMLKLFRPLIKVDVPEVVDINMPLETIFNGCALVSVRKGGRCGRELLRALWQTSLLRNARVLVLCDEEVDVRDVTVAWWRAVNKVDADRHLLVEGGKLGIDATGGPPAKAVAMDAAMKRRLAQRWRHYGLDEP